MAGSNTDGSFTTAISNSFLSLQHKKNIAEDIIVLGIIWVIFFFYIARACCVYTLESTR